VRDKLQEKKTNVPIFTLHASSEKQPISPILSVHCLLAHVAKTTDISYP